MKSLRKTNGANWKRTSGTKGRDQEKETKGMHKKQIRKLLRRYQQRRTIQNMKSPNIIHTANSEISCEEEDTIDQHPTIPHPQTEEKAYSATNTSISWHTPNITSESTPASHKKQNTYTAKNDPNRKLASESLSKSILRKTQSKGISEFPKNVHGTNISKSPHHLLKQNSSQTKNTNRLKTPL